MSTYLLRAGLLTPDLVSRSSQSPFAELDLDPLMAEASPVPSQPRSDPLASSQSFAKPSSPVKTSRSNPSPDIEESGRPGKRPRLNPPRMTAAAASIKPQTETSPNPTVQVISTLMAGPNPQAETSPATTTTTTAAPSATKAATTLSEPLTVVAENLQQPDPASGESQTQTSPVSLSSLGTIESVAAPSTMAATVNSPSSMEETGQKSPRQEVSASTSPETDNKAYSYPPPLLTPHTPSDRRHQSLPHSGFRQGSPRSPAKKHKCPYCSTEFTRHHNLKSHLLTHSQEKPYVCSTCQSRFRRLHDLKRHTKLHTGERPHICPKCGRKFARGDALARHNKGPTGCAGRRASMGSFNGEDDFEANDESMDGVMYNEPETIEDEEGNERRPGIKRHAPSGDDKMGDDERFSRIPSTYPPIQGRPPGGIASGNFPPRSNFAPSSVTSPTTTVSTGTLPYPHSTGSASGLHPHVAGPGTVFAQNPMTESPKPLSPSQSHPRPPGQGDLQHARSPSMTSQFTRGSSGRTASGASMHALPAPQLPPPHVLNPVDPRYTIPSQAGPTHPPTQPSGPPTHVGGSGPLSSQSNSLSSHGQGSGENLSGSGATFVSKDERLWAYVRNLEQRMNAMSDEIKSLKTQLAVATGQAHQQTQAQP